MSAGMKSLSSNTDSSTSPSRELALSLFEQGHVDQAIEMLRTLAGSASQSVHAVEQYWNDVGNMCAHANLLGEALSAFRRAVHLNPGDAMLWNNLGGILRRIGENQSAEFAFRQAIVRQDHFFAAHQNLAELLDARGEALEAARHHCIAYVEGPREGKSFEMLGVAYYHLGQKELAADIYRQWLDVEPDNPIAQHRLASCLTEGVPERMPDECVEAMFDAFAPSFDAHLAGLDYQGPQLISQALSQVIVEKHNLKILDAGCGTGLCGPWLRPLASDLIGIDISSGILEKARARNCYDQLEKSELTAHLQAAKGAYDLIVACDTLNYFGALLPVFQAMAQALKPKGVLAFTVEDDAGSSSTEGWQLAMHGRYVHTDAAIKGWLDQAGFKIQVAEIAPLRQELGVAVNAGIYVASLKDPVE
jgi:predicted TPR repeat methyltransferase